MLNSFAYIYPKLRNKCTNKWCTNYLLDSITTIGFIIFHLLTMTQIKLINIQIKKKVSSGSYTRDCIFIALYYVVTHTIVQRPLATTHYLSLLPLRVQCSWIPISNWAYTYHMYHVIHVYNQIYYVTEMYDNDLGIYIKFK